MFQIMFVGKIKRGILCSITGFSENRALYEIMWENMIQPERSFANLIAHTHAQNM